MKNTKQEIMKSGLTFIALLFTIDQFYLVAAYDDNSLLEDTNKGQSSGISTLKELLPGLKEILPNIDVGMDMVEQRCARFGSNESFTDFKKALEDFSSCIVNIVDRGEIKEEIEKEKLTGDLDKVFRKYCKKSGEMRRCVNEFANGWQPCLSATEKQNMPFLTNVSEALTNFICFKEGDRIALFISEGGTQCLNSTSNDVINNCGHFLVTPESITKAKKYAESFNSTSSDFPLLRLEKNDCEDITRFQKCAVSYLENCTEPTPANIIDSMFKYVIKSTKCQQYQPASSSFLTVSNVILIISGLLCTLTRLN